MINYRLIIKIIESIIIGIIGALIGICIYHIFRC